MADSHRAISALCAFLSFLTVQSLPIVSPNPEHVAHGLLARTVKEPTFEICNKIKYPPLHYPESNILARSPQKPTTYAPINWSLDSSFKFGSNVGIPAQGETEWYVSEHVLEYQLLFSKKGFLGTIEKIPNPSIKKNNKNLYGQCQVASPVGKGSKPTDFCTFMVTTWGNARAIQVDGISINAKPFDILSLSFPNNQFFTDELVLLDKQTNLMKEKIWSPKIKNIRRKATMQRFMKDNATAREAFFSIKSTMFALEYMTDAKIKQIFDAQASRIGKNFDEIEEKLASQFPTYERQHFGDAWRKWIVEHSQRSLAKAIGWLETWGPEFIKKFQPPGSPTVAPLGEDSELAGIRAGDPAQSGPDDDDDNDPDSEELYKEIKDGVPIWSGWKQQQLQGVVPATPANPAQTRPRPASSSSSDEELVSQPKEEDNPFGAKLPPKTTTATTKPKTEAAPSEDQTKQTKPSKKKPVKSGQPSSQAQQPAQPHDPMAPPDAPKKDKNPVDKLIQDMKDMKLKDSHTPSKTGPAPIPHRYGASAKLGAQPLQSAGLDVLAQSLAEELTRDWINRIIAEWKKGEFYGWGKGGGGSATGPSGGSGGPAGPSSRSGGGQPSKSAPGPGKGGPSAGGSSKGGGSSGGGSSGSDRQLRSSSSKTPAGGQDTKTTTVTKAPKGDKKKKGN